VILREHIIGFDRQLKNDLLNKTAYLVADGNKPDQVRLKLRESFEDQTSDALRKTINLLMGIWSKVPSDIQPLRDQAIKLFLDADDNDKRIIHYFMAVANYPFFYDVCLIAGRSLRLSDSIRSKQVISKIQEKWGERSTTVRATQRSLKTIEEWGWLTNSKQGVFSLNDNKVKPFITDNLQGFVINCLLFGSLKNTVNLDEIIQNPALFPFHFEMNLYSVRQWPGIRIEPRGRGDLMAVRVKVSR